jgi:uncharacterized protein involved in response to NO
MATSSAEQMRQWQGHALFSYGFRPFFLFGAIWAGFAMVLWVLALSGAIELPTRLDPVSWHAHAFLFGLRRCQTGPGDCRLLGAL